MGRSTPEFSTEAMSVLTTHPWPGNVRELRNVLERAVIVAGGADEILPEHIPLDVLGAARVGGELVMNPTLTMAEVERRHIAAALAFHEGNRSRTARSLGIGRRTLYDKLERYGIE